MDEKNGDFNFEQLAELPEELDFNQLKTCPHCKKPIPSTSTLCLYCGENTEISKQPKWVVWVAILVILSFLLLALR